MRARRLLGLAATAAALVAACSSDDPPAPVGPAPDGGETPDAAPPPEDGGGQVDAGADTAAPPIATVTMEKMTSSGRERTYVLVVPRTYDPAKTYPLVLVFHGQPGTAKGFHDYYPFEAASQQDAIIAYPDGTNREWNLYEASATNEDMIYIKDLIDALAAKYTIDKTRVLGDGYSNGGFFINQLACRFAGLLKAISVHAGGAPGEPLVMNPPTWPNGYLKCESGGPIAAIVLHGADDGVVTVGSGDFDAMYWAYVNGCQTTRSATTPAPCQKHDGCPADKPVHWCLVPGLGHRVWSQGAATAWGFFTSLP